MIIKKCRAGDSTPDAADFYIAGRDGEIHNTAPITIQQPHATARREAGDMHAPHNTGGVGAVVAMDFIRAWFGASDHPVYICSLANEKNDPNEPDERHVLTRDAADVARFIAKWDRPKRGIFFCISTIRPGGRRNKDGATEVCGLHADVDFRDVADNEATILRRVRGLPLPPSAINKSGNGLHLFWRLKEPIAINIVDGAETIERIEAALKLLADLVGGDTKVTHVAALMRLPGTHNSKLDQWKLVETIDRNDNTFELDDLEEMLSIASPIVLRKLREQGRTVGESNIWDEYSKKFKPPLDVERRLAAMLYMGGGDASIHETQIAVTSSMVSSDVDVDEIVSLVLGATRIASGEYGNRWNWRREEIEIRKACTGWQKKLDKKKVTEAETAATAMAASSPKAAATAMASSPETPAATAIAATAAKPSSKADKSNPIAPVDSEEFISLIFAERHEQELRFVAKWGQWFRWDATQWMLEETLHAFDLARAVCREAAHGCNKASTRKAIASAKTVAAVERLAKADRRLAATFSQWDAADDKFNTIEED